MEVAVAEVAEPKREYRVIHTSRGDFEVPMGPESLATVVPPEVVKRDPVDRRVHRVLEPLPVQNPPASTPAENAGEEREVAGDDCPSFLAESPAPPPPQSVVMMDRAFDILTIPGHRRLCAEIYGDTYEHMHRLIARGRDPRWVYLHVALAVLVVLWTIMLDWYSKAKHGDKKRSPGSGE